MSKPTEKRQAWYLFEISSTLRQARKRIASNEDALFTQAQAVALLGVRRFEGTTQSDLADHMHRFTLIGVNRNSASGSLR